MEAVPQVIQITVEVMEAMEVVPQVIQTTVEVMEATEAVPQVILQVNQKAPIQILVDMVDTVDK